MPERPGRPYRYEATIRLVIYADGQDAAWRLAKEAADAAKAPSNERATLESARASMSDLRYEPVRERRPAPVHREEGTEA